MVVNKNVNCSTIKKERKNPSSPSCPKCKKPEIGTDWISCDKCGEWYHLTINCVGIDVAPPDNVKWFCPVCKNKEKGKKSSKKEKSGSKAVAKSGSSKVW